MTATPRTWTVDTTHAGVRLDVFLTEAQQERTRSAVQKALKQGFVTVNGEATTVHRFLKAGDVILTGTPEGLANVKPGDTVETEIEQVGCLINTIVGDPPGLHLA